MKPYGYVRKDGEGLFIYGEHQFQNAMDAELVPVYLHPKEWVGLTNNELQPIADEYRILFGGWVEDFARAIEAKLKKKNT